MGRLDSTPLANKAKLENVVLDLQNVLEAFGAAVAVEVAEEWVLEIQERIESQKGRWKQLAESTVKRKKRTNPDNAEFAWKETGTLVENLAVEATKDGAIIYVKDNPKHERSKTDYKDIIEINEGRRPVIVPAFNDVMTRFGSIVDKALDKAIEEKAR